jgi:hypothetical protein
MHRANAALNLVYRNQVTSAVNLGSMKNYLSRARFAIDRAQFRPQADDASQSLGKARNLFARPSLNGNPTWHCRYLRANARWPWKSPVAGMPT